MALLLGNWGYNPTGRGYNSPLTLGRCPNVDCFPG